MNALIRITFLALLISAGGSYGQSNLPACPSSGYFHNCFGTFTYADGNKYVVEYKDGKRNGQFTVTFANGDKYVGEYKDDKIDGQGTYTYANGTKFVGEFKGGKRNGQGTLYASNGSITNQGIWADGNFVRSTPVQQATTTNPEIEKLRAEAEEAKRKQAEAELRLAQQQALEVEESKRKQAELQEQLLVAQQQSNQLTSTSSTQALALNENSIRNAHALIIGNSAYIGGGRLPNPVNDARLMASKLRTMGFKVTIVEDANRIKLVSALGQFNRSAATADLTLFFYSGHGVQIFGTNYILPVDLDQSDLAQATLQGISLNSIVEQFMPGKTKLVFLDACRTNPLAVASARGFSKGLAPISASEGTLIAYAAKDGQEAADGVVGKNSPFTSALVAHLSDPDDIAVVLRKVRSDVMKNTAGKQQPWDYGSLTGGALVLSAIKPK